MSEGPARRPPCRSSGGGEATSGLEAGSVYAPGFVSDGRPVAGPDEDAFTFLAAAWEQLSPAEPGASRPRTVHLVGAFPPVVEWSIAALLGHPVELALHPGGVQGAREVIDALEGDAASTFPQLLLAAELPERAAPGPGPPRPPARGRSPFGSARARPSRRRSARSCSRDPT